MAIFHSPKIVTDGLIFYVDAQNTNSYNINDGVVNNLGKKEAGTNFKKSFEKGPYFLFNIFLFKKRV